MERSTTGTMGRGRSACAAIAVLGAAITALAAGCEATEDEALDDDELVEERIFGGWTAPQNAFSFVVAIEKQGDPHHCAGTHIAPGWVMTARHCVNPARPFDYQVIAGRHDLTTSAGVTASVLQIVDTSGSDVALLRLDRQLALPTVALAGPYEANGFWEGERATVVGWGTDANGVSTNVLRETNLEILGVGDECSPISFPGECEDPQHCLPGHDEPVSQSEMCIGGIAGAGTCGGDSGGPALIRKHGRWVQVGILSWGASNCAVDATIYALVSKQRDWIGTQIAGQHAITPGDFDGLNGTDSTITTSTGSVWEFSTGNGMATTIPAATRPDLPFTRAEYIPGYFNSDTKTDLIITTPSGSWWYMSRGDGTWDVPMSDTSLSLGKVDFVLGDWNGDGHVDFLRTTASGTEWWSSNANGTFTKTFGRNDLKLGLVEYAAGDFDNDMKTDMIVTTPGGSEWYYGRSDGNFDLVATDTTLGLGRVEYVTGNFDGQFGTDLVVTTITGSRWWFSTGARTWSIPYSRSDLPLGTVAYVAGDFDHNGKTDLAITTASGTFWYFWTNLNNAWGSTWTSPAWRADLKLGQVRYTPGDYNNDAKTDLVITTTSGSYWYLSTGAATWTVPRSRADLRL